MRIPKLVTFTTALAIVVGLAFVAGMAAQHAIVSRGISWRHPTALFDPKQKLQHAIKSRQTSAQYVAVRDFFSEYPGDAKIAMFGDLQIAFADWPLLLGIPVANRGIYGETSAGALLRVDSILAAHPKCVVTMFGIADLSIGRSVETTAKDYLSILDRLTTSGTKTIVQSTLLTETPHSLNEKVRELNARLRAACGSNCLFLDLDDIISPGSTIDGIHLKPKTYKKWAAKLKPAIMSQCAPL